MATLSERLQAEIDRANTTTNKTDTTVHDAVGSLIEGYGTGGLEVSEHSWNQIPTLVKNYLDNVTYDPSDYSTSQIANYAPSTADVNNTYPIGKTIAVESGILERKGYEKSVSNGNVELVNDIPNQYTPYIVRNDGVISHVGTLKPTGFLRQIKCATTNVRDLGGWACDGGTVKYGKLFRGGEFQEADLDIFLNQLGIKHELNLRGTSEANGEITKLRDYVGFTCPTNYVWMNISDSTTWTEILGCVFDCVIHNKPLYFHCSAGADRTGTVACIIEAILGMSQSDIDKDYELTNFMTGTSSDTQARRRNESEWQGMMSAINSLAVGTTFRDKVINWVDSLGFTVDEINAFRSAMIDGTPDIIVLGEELTGTYVNKMVVQSSNLNKRISGTSIAGTTANGTFICDPVEVDITKKCPVIFKNFASTMASFSDSGGLYGNSKVALLNSSKNPLAVWYIGTANEPNVWSCPASGNDCVGDLSTILLNSPAAGTLPSASDVKYVIFSPTISTSALTTASLDGLEILMLEDEDTGGDSGDNTTTTVPVTYLGGKACTYNVGSACTVSESSAYFITEEIPVEYGKTYTLECEPTADSTFRWIGVDDDDVVTEVVTSTITQTNHTASWTPTQQTTTGLRLRGYVFTEGSNGIQDLTEMTVS